MEQRIGSSSQPLEGAGFDPAFIPGLTSPASSKPEDAEPRDGKATEEPRAEEETAAPGGTTAPGEADAADDAEEAEEAVDGPVFEAADRRARVVADHKGVRLSLDDQSCEFRWDEIGAIETETARFGKRFTLTVHTPDRRWYPIEVEAAARSRFKEWEEQLDAVLDAYFEDGAEAGEADEPEATEAVEKDDEAGQDD
ncbi:hypothetical protein GCM10010129_20700 [Streptomyces fumigatiscleroticus]|nr:hypothetical protein GCM10010129_20700 [Streptomyces fumigatiscleroticus]